jgi:hypothetical protein
VYRLIAIGLPWKLEVRIQLATPAATKIGNRALVRLNCQLDPQYPAAKRMAKKYGRITSHPALSRREFYL